MELNFVREAVKSRNANDFPDYNLENYATNGFAIIRNEWPRQLHEEIVLEIERIHQNFSELKAVHSELYKLGEWSIRSPHVASESIHQLFFAPIFRKICNALIGADIDMYWAATAAKPAQRGKSFPWHQDAGYGKGPAEYITCWTAFDSVNEENGCLWAIPGSHRQEILPHEFRKSDENNYAGLFLKNLGLDVSSAIPMVLNPGDIVCMDSKLIHASTPNFSERKRRGMIVAYARSQLIEMHKGQIEEVTVPFLRNGNLC